jgi:hypothetical protein|tara:strand:- start:981 stop:2066 length:1086 start_codon:yes stop_codon:yes gene_type:complete
MLAISQWQTNLTNDGQKIAYASSPIYSNPVYIFIVRNSQGVPEIVIGMEKTIAGGMTASFKFEDVILSSNIGNLLKYNFNQIIGKNYNFYSGTENASKIVSYLKKETFVNLKIFLGSNKLEGKIISLSGSSSSINYALGVKLKKSKTKKPSNKNIYKKTNEDQNRSSLPKIKNDVTDSFKSNQDSNNYYILFVVLILSFVIFIFVRYKVTFLKKEPSSKSSEENNRDDLEVNLKDKVHSPEIKYENQNPINSGWKSKLKNFNRKQPLYQQIRWTLIVLFWVNAFAEIIFQEIQMHDGNRSTISFVPVFITFWIARTIMRNQFNKNPLFENKIIYTIGVFIGVYVIKVLIGLIFLSFFSIAF